MGGFSVSINEIKEIAEKNNCAVISDKKENGIRKISLSCNVCGNIWKKTPSIIKNEKIFCSRCKIKNRPSARSELERILKTSGYELLTLGDFDMKTSVDIFCPIHRISWKSSCWSFKYGRGSCKMCASNSPSYEDVKNLVESKNGTLIERTKRTKNNDNNIVVKCNAGGHVFKTRLGSLRRGHWCHACEVEGRKITHEQIDAAVKSKNGTLLTENCSTATMLFNVKCNVDGCGMEWETSYARIYSGCWCPKCVGFDKYTLDEVNNLIGDRGTLLTKEIISAQQKLDIRCKCGNNFSMYLYNIVRGRWCQVCSERYSTQKELYSIIRDITRDKEMEFNYYGFDWLRDKYKLEIDIWVPSIKMAIEYDGKQHYVPVKFAKTMTDEQAENAFKITQCHDQLKDKLIAEHPDEVKHFIRFNYKQSITKEFVLQEIQRLCPTLFEDSATECDK